MATIRPMRALGTRRLLFVLALVFSQWLVVAHAAAHPALAVDLHCQICLHAPGIDGGALASKPVALLPCASTEVPASPATGDIRAATYRDTRIRGPPSLLV